MISKSLITIQLKEIIERLDGETADGRVQAVTIAYQIRSDLDRLLSSIREHEETGTQGSRPLIEPKQASGIVMKEALNLRARLLKATDDLDRG
jgi:hypothetical protein